MGHYKANLRDLEFNLFEVFGGGQRMGTGPFAEMDPDTARGVLRELTDLATGPLAASFTDADRNPPTFDPQNHSVQVPESFKKSFAAIMDGQWWRLELTDELGGYGAPPSLRWACAELILGANPALFMYAAGPTFAQTLYYMGTDEQKKLAKLVIDQGWGATMVLTEPDAGSDVGAGRTKAIRQPDGSWHLEGVKRFITSGDQDMTDNILHLVLARPEGPGVETKPGTKGLSLFAVPKYHVDLETGERGERNGVFVTGVEHKMGLKVSATCELSFGLDGTPAVGTLVGDVHDGIAQMFKVIEYARMMVGTKAIATLSTGYLNALDYAKERVQGADLTRAADKTAPRVSIIHHPDVRRILMRQKAYAEGLRAVYSYTADLQDQIFAATATTDTDEQSVELAKRINDLLLPVVKGVGSERAYENLALSLQTFGGSGYTQDYPIEQYLRDAKIDTLYEGTTAIQAQDFFFRKILKDRGVALGAVAGEMLEFLQRNGSAAADAGEGDGRLKTEFAALGRALTDVQGMIGTLTSYATGAAQDPASVYKVGEHAVSLLLSVGDLMIGYLLLRQAVIAQAALDNGATGPDADFYAGKVAVASWFARNMLPELTGRRKVIEAADTSLMQVPESAF
ncbi:acyl-CoA dehydrogenase [Nakamurella aerolata]|uniref:Broad-specificity linear acyl-CoA dehydrogenase FadE5 n=1 Tax=Nakamurella aerolata TaxID=1656892 RepID=A0A849A5B4_9ACTN|nr:acyl-CoA dehydrogenase [Nakamurella aerolata]NNG35715.1 acyl-CoA dehydrogenase [Nakamurella aerolata]